jgi:hypothetical protein
MTTDEAYAYTMEIVEELRHLGIEATFRPSKSMTDPEVVAKYSGPERVKPERWGKVTFKSFTPQQAQAIREKQQALGWLGIHFDSGGCVGQRDWEIDYSFKYTGAPASGETEQAVSTANDLIDGLEAGTLPAPDPLIMELVLTLQVVAESRHAARTSPPVPKEMPENIRKKLLASLREDRGGSQANNTIDT